jgi:hypothetical protein
MVKQSFSGKYLPSYLSVNDKNNLKGWISEKSITFQKIINLGKWERLPENILIA